MEEHLRERQHAYSTNASLVITTGTGKRRHDLPTGEVEPLNAATDPKSLMAKMGDRAMRNNEPLKKKPKTSAKAKRIKVNQKVAQQVNQYYRPSNPESAQAHELLTLIVESHIGAQPSDVMHSCVEEVLECMKEEAMSLAERRKLLESFLGKFGDEEFNRLLTICQRVTDFVLSSTKNGSEPGLKNDTGIDEELGVAVVFDEEEEEEVEDGEDDDMNLTGKITDYVVDDEEETDLHSTASGDEGDVVVSRKLDEITDSSQCQSSDRFDISSIDAFWLQRHISSFESDPVAAQQKAEQVLVVLSPEKSARFVENKIAQILGYENFDFIKILLKHRFEILYCTRLARASNDEEKASIIKEMQSSPILAEILLKINGARNSKVNEEKTIGKSKGGKRKPKVPLLSTEDDEIEVDIASQDFGWGSTYRPSGMLDLDNLKFSSEGRFMSNSRWTLPKDSWKRDHKGFQEIFVPAPRATEEQVKAIRKVKISEMPSWAQAAFEGYDALNLVQSKLYNTLLFSANNVLLCAPTGAGKTNCALLAMLREIGLAQREDGTIDTSSFKIIYIAPMKSLVREMVGTFSQRLGSQYGLKVEELSGDQSLTSLQLAETNIIVTTPEKWDIVTRKGAYGNRSFTELVRLIIFDEIHLLHDSRGPVLESVVARTIRHVESSQELTRLVGLSATLPNFHDVAVFLRVKLPPEEGLFVFDNSFRPCPLQQTFIGVTQKRAFKKHQMMNEITYEKVLEQRQRKNQIIVFVHSRKETFSTAQLIKDTASSKDHMPHFVQEDSASARILNEEARNVKDERLKSLLPYGFGMHHAGLNRADRSLVEDLFRAGHIQVLCSTATLAWGVNLPAHTVLIKGTQVYNPEKGTWVELSMLDVMQMLGRAGRPQYDTYGEGIIITTHVELKYYMSLLNEQLPVESQLISKICSALNAEIALGSVRNIRDAVLWLGYTYLYVRMLQNPTLYSVSLGYEDSDPRLFQYRVDLAHTSATILARANLIKYDKRSGTLHATSLGRISSYYYISHSSMLAFNESLKPVLGDVEILRIFSLSEEFKYVSVREQEKQELAKLMDQVPIPVKGDIESQNSKICVLLQTYVSRLALDGFSLVSDMVFITQSAGRLMRGLFEIALSRGWSSTAVKILGLCKSIEHRMWEIESPLRQFKSIPPEIIKRLEKMNFPWENFLDLNAAEVGELIKFQKFGKKIHSMVHHIPRLEIEAHVQPITRTMIRIELTLTPDFVYDYDLHGGQQLFWIFVEDNDSETILHHEFFVLKAGAATTPHIITVTVPLFEPQPPQYFIRTISDRWIGSETVLPVIFRNLILPSKFLPPTTLLDLHPMKTSEIQDEELIELFEGRVTVFNSIQTQCFPSFYDSDENSFVSAPSGSGKFILAEIALYRALKTRDGFCVIVAPNDAICHRVLDILNQGFGSKLGVQSAKLTGDTATDQHLLASAKIILATAQVWDQFSRRWRTRLKLFQQVSLFVALDLQFLSESEGPILEIVVSRMRVISTQLDSPFRIISFSSCVANARDIAEWVGASAKNVFCFHPNARPVPLEISIHGLYQNEYEYRILGMIKPCFMSLCQKQADTVILFASTRKLVRRIAAELMDLTASSSRKDRFLGSGVDAEHVSDQLTNVTLKETVLLGIGFLHTGLDSSDTLLVTRLFLSETIRILIVERELIWNLSLKSSMVILMDTQYYNGNERRYVDYPMLEVSEMLGCASRQSIDTESTAIIFCHNSKKAYLRKFLFEPQPVESQLDHSLPDIINAEIVAKTIVDLQGCMDYMTWTFMYRRLTQNPNYYNLRGNTNRHLSDFLSELLEKTLEVLENAGLLSLQEDRLIPNNPGFIVSFYYLKYSTVELFNNSISQKTGLKGILDIISAATEFDNVVVGDREDVALEKLARRVRLRTPSQDFADCHNKVHLLLQAHFSRLVLPPFVAEDQARVLLISTRLLQAIVDVISSQGYLLPALAAMELHQMVVQGVWNDNENVLFQLPHMTEEIVSEFAAHDIKDVPSFIDCDDQLRSKILSLPPSKVAEIAQVCNQFPDVELSAAFVQETVEAGSVAQLRVEIDSEPAFVQETVEAGSVAQLRVEIDSEPQDEEIFAPRYPQSKFASYWLVVGDAETDNISRRVYAVKKVSGSQKLIQVSFQAPAESGIYPLALYLVSDSFIGFDDETALVLQVSPASDVDEKEEDDDN